MRTRTQASNTNERSRYIHAAKSVETVHHCRYPLSSAMAIFSPRLNDLLKLWEVDFTDPETATCELAETIGLFCYENIAGLNEMNDFNRPVIMNLNGRWFTLTGIDRDRATVLYGKRLSISDSVNCLNIGTAISPSFGGRPQDIKCL